jgi:hypothetical protein
MMVGGGGWWLKISGQESGDGKINTAGSSKEQSEETPQTSGDVQMSKRSYPELCTTYILF